MKRCHDSAMRVTILNFTCLFNQLGYSCHQWVFVQYWTREMRKMSFVGSDASSLRLAHRDATVFPDLLSGGYRISWSQ